ncbi:MAG TPA: penicillin-binding transpeptidase domain-containing protein [Candidatus Ozemobacteraceae bacterium]|nr:penicillin-binding transpeptidase domain-containing protein [Candidatus Ozemobacteraceae bacterium]
MVSNYFKPLNILCIVLYIAFMGIALDSQVVEALVLKIADRGEKPRYVAESTRDERKQQMTAQASAEAAAPAAPAVPVVTIRYDNPGPVTENQTSSVSKPAALDLAPAAATTESLPTNETVTAMKPAGESPATENIASTEMSTASIDMQTTEAASARSENESFEVAYKSAAAEAMARREPNRVQALPLRASTAASTLPGKAQTAATAGSASAITYIDAISRNKWEFATLLDRYIVRYDSETYIVLTVRPTLQKMLENILERYSNRIGVAIIQDPATGEILAMSSSHRGIVTSIETEEFKTDNWALKPTFPVASIFKIVTGAAAIDTGKINSESSFLAWGKTYMTVWKAFANSHNGVFGRIAKKIGRDVLEKYTAAFGFNKPFFFDLPVGKSLADLPNDQIKLGQAAAGLNRDFLVSPMHVASIISTVLNRGKTMKPYLVDYVVRKNKVIFRRKPFQLAQPIKSSTAREIYKMMYGTTSVGTGKKGFGGYSSCPDLATICGGKTGTLTGASPNYLFTWFGGFTKATGRDLCIVTLSGQPNHSGTKASSIAGQIAYELYMKRQGKDPAAVAKKTRRSRR